METLGACLEGFCSTSSLLESHSPTWASLALCLIVDGTPGELESLGQEGIKAAMSPGLRDRNTRGKSQEPQCRGMQVWFSLKEYFQAQLLVGNMQQGECMSSIALLDQGRNTTK